MKKAIFDELKSKPNSQHRFEIWQLIEFLELFDLKNVVEIGVFQGGTARFFRHISDKNGIFIGIDSGERGFLPKVKEEFKKDPNFYIIEGDSTSADTVKQLKGREFDFIFIDGNHESQYVMSDFKNYSKFIKPGGLLGFHDLVNPSVRSVWKQVKLSNGFYPVLEIYGELRPCGIGVLQKETG